MLVLLSYFVGRQFNLLFGLAAENASGIWCAISAIVVFDDSREGVRKLARTRALGTLIGALIGFLAIYIIPDVRGAVAAALIAASLVVNLLKVEGALKIACTALLIVCMSAYDKPPAEMWMIAQNRFITSMLGGVLAVLATIALIRLTGNRT